MKLGWILSLSLLTGNTAQETHNNELSPTQTRIGHFLLGYKQIFFYLAPLCIISNFVKSQICMTTKMSESCEKYI